MKIYVAEFTKRYRVSLKGNSPNAFSAMVGGLLVPENIMWRWDTYWDGFSGDNRVLAATGPIGKPALARIRKAGYGIKGMSNESVGIER